jgi:hypothetical protein
MRSPLCSKPQLALGRQLQMLVHSVSARLLLLLCADVIARFSAAGHTAASTLGCTAESVLLVESLLARLVVPSAAACTPVHVAALDLDLACKLQTIQQDMQE